MLKYSVIAPQLSPGAVRRAARPAAGPDRKQQIDIKDIPIATITQQYLEYMEKARRVDIGPRRGVRLHGGDPDPHQEQDAPAARSAWRPEGEASEEPRQNWWIGC